MTDTDREQADARFSDVSEGAPSLRILQVSAFFPSKGGGIEVVAHQLSRSLARLGHRVTHVAGSATEEDHRLAGSEYRLLDSEAVDVLGPRVGLPMPLWSLGSLRSLWRAVAENDVVHFHDYLYLPCLAAFLFARWQRKKVVVTQHIGEIPFDGRFKNALLRTLNLRLGVPVLRRCDAVVFVGDNVHDYFTHLAPALRAGAVIPNGVDHETYRPGPPPTSGGPAEFLFVGRFVEKKGIELLRRCMDLHGIRWTFVGDGPLSPSRWPTTPAPVRVLSGLRGAELVPLYQQAHLLVLPSVGEGFPLVVQEALACGTPVLISDEVEASFRMLDRDCVFTAHVASSSDPVPALRARLEALASDRTRLADARPKALALSRQWSWQATARSYEALYRRIGSRTR